MGAEISFCGREIQSTQPSVGRVRGAIEGAQPSVNTQVEGVVSYCLKRQENEFMRLANSWVYKHSPVK